MNILKRYAGAWAVGALLVGWFLWFVMDSRPGWQFESFPSRLPAGYSYSVEVDGAEVDRGMDLGAVLTRLHEAGWELVPGAGDQVVVKKRGCLNTAHVFVRPSR
jgi:hypothetical protein